MEQLRSHTRLAAVGVLVVAAAALGAQSKARVAILATGGTIAGAGSASEYGYKAGAFKVEDLIKAVPQIDKLAQLSGEQVASIGSQDMNDQVWLTLARRVNELLAGAETDGVVITHGTDTMEETAYFLNLVVKSDKPVVMVGSMRPATAISPDGPANLYDGVAVASDPNARRRGVMVVLNDEIHTARNVTKTNTTSLQTFVSPNRGPAGFVHTGKIAWFEPIMDKKNTARSEFSVQGVKELPRVDIIYAHANMQADLIHAAIKNGARGLVIAGVGDGNMSQAALEALAAAVKSGVVVVRSTRLERGMVLRNNEVDDDKMGFVASGELNPPKARVLLQLALLQSKDPVRVQQIFDQVLMSALFHFLQAQPFIALFAVVALGMILGRPAIRGISLGSVVCIVFVGLLASIGSFRSTGVALALPDVIKTIFFNIFIFSMGMKIGPQFFAGLQRDGWHMVTIGLVAAVLAPATSYFFGWLFDLPAGAVAGLMAGSNNSSATFGTASAALQSSAFQPPSGVTVDQVSGMLSASFALCYSVSQVQFVLFMKLLPTLARLDAPKAAREFEASMRADRTAPLPGTVEAADAVDASIAVRAYRVSEKTLAGKSIGDIRRTAPGVAIELVRRGSDWLPIDDQTTLAAGDEVVVSAPLDKQVRVREVLGPEVPDVEARALRPVHTVDVVISHKDAAGRSLPDLLGWVGGGLYPNAVFRAGVELPAGPATKLVHGDVIRVTGTDAHIADLGTRVGYVIRATHASSLLTLAVGLVVGALIGTIPVPLFGISITFGATAVLLTGIVFGWLKTRHPAFGGQISEGARSLMEEMGLNTFTSALAINSGLAVYQVATTGPIWQLLIASQFVSLFPPLVAWWVGRYLLHLNPALLMGAVAGARQNTTSMRAAQKESQSAVPGIGYPVPLAVATIALSVMGYFFALFA